MVGKSLAKQQQPVMWSETVGLRTRPVWDPKKSFLVLHTAVLVLQVWCCVVKHGLVMLVVIMILKVTATFQVLFILSLFCAWTSLLWRSTVAFTYLKVKSAKRLCLLPVAWSCYFGLGLKNLVLFTSLQLSIGLHGQWKNERMTFHFNNFTPFYTFKCTALQTKLNIIVKTQKTEHE